MNPFFKRVISWGSIILLGYFTCLLVLITLQYVPIRLDVAFLNVKQSVVHLKHYQVAFFSHVFTSIWVLVFAVVQFIPGIRDHLPQIHRFTGKLYIFLVLVIASPSGFVMGYYANGGWVSQISFMIQAILWFYFTFLGFQMAKRMDWEKHQLFMWRSFALTLSAITLRLFKWIIIGVFEWPPMDTYRLVAWLGWVFNLMGVEILWYYKYAPKGRNGMP
ncbi:hypothetical protein A9Q93_03985 [Nonlabens dokdonensis]|mgnify:CR=1 FL=1|uniref:DUF2306 domain-containing protein n=1 Tax=Nonlabens dokdonensis TaxID=328515 RepID=A0A1Z8B706_9FLAO|nr:DUF2306 domain-containing protein [Nonlabens dokdonensis]OUS18268.1 hypothetical protein A9Q93_03985 [Nonlabens dokdonensis]